MPLVLVKPVTAVVGKEHEADSFVASTASALAVALGIAFGTFLMPYSKDFSSEPLVCLAPLACFLGAVLTVVLAVLTGLAGMAVPREVSRGAR